MKTKCRAPWGTVFFLVAVFSAAQTPPHSVSLFSTPDDYQTFLAQLPKSTVSRPQGDVLAAHFNFGLGSQFNTPVSLSAIVCDQSIARKELSTSISGVLTRHQYSLGSGWDKFGFLRATRIGGREIDLTSATSEEIDLDVKVDQTELGERAITFGYQVLTYLRVNDPSTRQDRSSEKAVERYMENLRGEMRQAAEASLKVSCTRNVVNEITTEESAIQKMASTLKLTRSQEDQLRSALRKSDVN
jgi:hypothetical protein